MWMWSVDKSNKTWICSSQDTKLANISSQSNKQMNEISFKAKEFNIVVIGLIFEHLVSKIGHGRDKYTGCPNIKFLS